MKVVETSESLSVGDITEEMLDRNPLPIGLSKFTEWSERIIKGAGLDEPGCGWTGSKDELKFLLCEVLQHIGPTEAFKEDAYFILRLRNILIKETAFRLFTKIKQDQQKHAEDTAPNLKAVSSDGLLENKTV